MAISIRAARADDVPALVQLRMANAERHVGLDPSGHRLPEASAVRRYFACGNPEISFDPAAELVVSSRPGRGGTQQCLSSSVSC